MVQPLILFFSRPFFLGFLFVIGIIKSWMTWNCKHKFLDVQKSKKYSRVEESRWHPFTCCSFKLGIFFCASPANCQTHSVTSLPAFRTHHFLAAVMPEDSIFVQAEFHEVLGTISGHSENYLRPVLGRARTFPGSYTVAIVRFEWGWSCRAHFIKKRTEH